MEIVNSEDLVHHTHTQIYFKKSAYMILGSGKPEVCTAGWKLGQKLPLQS